MKTTSITTTTPVFFLGIDVGKNDLYCHLITPTETRSQRFENSDSGIQNLLAWLQPLADFAQLAACLEQTGPYGKAVAKALYSAKVSSLHLVNPRRIKAYGEQKLRRNKSDTADAKLIAEFLRSEHHELRTWKPQPADREQITELSRYAQSLTEDNAKLKTTCESVQNKAVLRSLMRRIKTQKKEIIDIRQRINALISKRPSLKIQKELLDTIPGLGEITQQIIIAEVPDIELFANARQLAAWVGLTPRHFESGTSGRTRTPITKVGSTSLRSALYLPAMTAKVHNPLLKEFAARLKENGKQPKEIIVALMRKLIHQIFGILKSEQPFNPEKRGFNAPSQVAKS